MKTLRNNESALKRQSQPCFALQVQLSVTSYILLLMNTTFWIRASLFVKSRLRSFSSRLFTLVLFAGLFLSTDASGGARFVLWLYLGIS